MAAQDGGALTTLLKGWCDAQRGGDRRRARLQGREARVRLLGPVGPQDEGVASCLARGLKHLGPEADASGTCPAAYRPRGGAAVVRSRGGGAVWGGGRHRRRVGFLERQLEGERRDPRCSRSPCG